MGVFILGERLRPLQWTAMGVAGVAVVVLAIDYGRLPWVALVLAFSFGCYGLAKKTANVPAVESLTLETALIAPFALAYVGWLTWQGQAEFGAHGAGHALLLTTTGIVTAIPLICFGAAAIRVSMVSLGHAAVPRPHPAVRAGRLLVPRGRCPPAGGSASALVWLALVVFTVEAVHHHRRRQLRLTVEASAI